jgi:hypothetical protein|nr:MAG TPA: hypothetical protein [Caudoviricetes sp.]
MAKFGLTKENLENQIVSIEYNRFGEVGIQCVLTLNNGYTVTGESGCIDPTIFSEEIGKSIAYENAFDKLWPILGYQEKQRWFIETQTTWVDRLLIERQELDKKLKALTGFIFNPDGSRSVRSEAVSENQWELMYEQHTAMEQYLRILDQRLKLAEVTA